MSEFTLLIARGRRWPECCGRLVKESRLYWLGTSLRYNGEENSGKLLYPVPLGTRTIFRYLAWWNPIELRLSLTEGRGACRGVSSAQKQKSWPRNEEKLDRRAESSLTLQELCGFSAEEADKHVDNFKNFSFMTAQNIRQNYKKLVEFGFSEKVIRGNPEALSTPIGILDSKIGLLNFMKWGRIDDTIPFLRMNTRRLQQFAGTIKYETTHNKGNNRITILSKKLQCPHMAVSQVFAKHVFMQIMPLAKMEYVLDIMLDAQISSEDILSDIWALRYNIHVIRNKLRRVTDAGVFPVKPWMIRCTEKILSRRIQKEAGQRSVLGENGTTLDYLMERFQCSKEEVTELTVKYPRILRLTGPAIKRKIDFLLENGYTIEDIRRVPKILFHSTTTLKDRLAEMGKYNHKPKSLMAFCISKQQYKTRLHMIRLQWLRSFTPLN